MEKNPADSQSKLRIRIAIPDLSILIKGRIRSGRFLSILTVDFPLFLAPVGGSNPAGHS